MLDHQEIAIVKGMLARGDKQHDIAAYFGVNGGRIAEIATGIRGIGVGVEAAGAADLPPAGPAMAGRSALRALNTLRALRDLINESIEDIERFERGGD